MIIVSYRYKLDLNINVKLTKKGTQQPRLADKTSVTDQQGAGDLHTFVSISQFRNILQKLLTLTCLLITKKCRFLGYNTAYEEINNTTGNDQQCSTTEVTPENDGYLKPVVYEEVREPYEELKHQHPAVRDGVIDLICNIIVYPSPTNEFSFIYKVNYTLSNTRQINK